MTSGARSDEFFRRAPVVALFIAGLLVTACAIDTAPSSTSAASKSSKVIYGDDDREELEQSQYTTLGAISMAFIPERAFRAPGDGASWREANASRNWCPNERFAEQPAVAQCGGVAIAASYVLTASHCVPDRIACGLLEVVRGYALSDTGRFDVDQLDRYQCDDVVMSVKSDLLAPQAFDFSIVHLSRPIVDFSSAMLELDSVRVGETVVSVSPSAGLPLKVSRGEVSDYDSKDGFFHATVDFFAGGSGSGLFNDRAELLGILVNGETDYAESPEGCFTARTIDSNQGASGELGNDVGAILNLACKREHELPFCATHPGTEGTRIGRARKPRLSYGPTRSASCSMGLAPRELRAPNPEPLGLIALVALARRRRRPSTSPKRRRTDTVRG